MNNDNFLNPVEIWNLVPGDIISANGLPARVFTCSLDGQFSVQLIKPSDAEASEPPYDYSRIIPSSELESVGLIEISKEILQLNCDKEEYEEEDEEAELPPCTHYILKGVNGDVGITYWHDDHTFAICEPDVISVEIHYINEIQHLLRGWDVRNFHLANNFKV